MLKASSMSSNTQRSTFAENRTVSVKALTANAFRLDTSPLNRDACALAEKELRETPEQVQQSLAELRKYLKEKDTLLYKDADEYLMIFLRPTKFYVESAYNLMKRLADFKEKNNKIIGNPLPREEKRLFTENNVVNVLVDRDQKNRRVLILNMGSAWDPKKLNSEELFKVLYLIQVAALVEEETQVRGAVIIIDFHGLSTKQVMAMSPSFAMTLLLYIQESMPLRLKEVHIVRQPFLFNMVWPMFKQFVGDKLKKRLFFHGNKMSSLHKHLDVNMLPEDYGGKKPKMTYSSSDWYPVIQDLQNYIADWNTYGLKH
ncbi:Cellular retinaldehyde binding/alpha-tocopherol transport,CRAL/TRIO, N-terminal domain,CRAL-TRIO lipid [Cinara cedri]|uniref:Cellular retinaldehyde binding/alpha-tocopherol transport,CRAL/TRIO, N-terminal domain,CRAL-TRIO lipid n=1 Tax=Cinara cedri TaxID=506608 RepID=A0A5E4NPW0_9HEMI|nr:Cellular retinaldehyde binding/alpha-tocopherol transport,CRAL/TRIO, N-terminal domain,CRAL-TRIO lipid [Cinara cedri]